MTDTQREAFERAALWRGWATQAQIMQRTGNHYESDELQYRYEAWQQAISLQSEDVDVVLESVGMTDDRYLVTVPKGRYPVLTALSQQPVGEEDAIAIIYDVWGDRFAGEAEAIIKTLFANGFQMNGDGRYAGAIDLLRRIEPHIDAIVCYASTMDEHEPNRLAVDLRDLLTRFNISDRGK